MSILTVDVLFALITVGMGLGAGWWLSSRGAPPQEAPVDKEEVNRARELLVCLQKLAANVAGELGEHNTRVEAINVELQADKLDDPAKILNAVTRIVDANKTMQGRLDQAEDRLREQVRLVESHAAEARTDALTLVGNRRAFDADAAELFERFVRTGQPFSLAMIDLDKFKRLNDTYGHQAGDEVLRGTGRVLRRVLRDTESIARYGGEEFAVLFRNTARTEVQRALTRLRKAIARSDFEFPGGKLQVTISIGTAECRNGEALEALIERADAALYASKEAGRNCGHWHDGTDIQPIVEEQATPAPTAAVQPPPAPEPPKTEPAPIPETMDTAGTAVEGTVEDLPGVLNRTAFFQHVRGRVAEWKRGGPTLSLVLIEIDRFDALAQQHGSKLRDLLVRTLVRVVVAGVRDMDVVARYSTACLAFLLPKAELINAVQVAERIREAASQVTLPVAGRQVRFTVSVGVIEVGSTDDMVALFRNAETALDASRQEGGNCLFHHNGECCLPASTLAGSPS